MDAKPCSRTHCSRTSGGFNPRLPWDHMCDVRMTSHGFPGGTRYLLQVSRGSKGQYRQGWGTYPTLGDPPPTPGKPFPRPGETRRNPPGRDWNNTAKISTLIFYGKSRLATTSHHQDNSRKNLSNYKDNLPACCNKKKIQKKFELTCFYPNKWGK